MDSLSGTFCVTTRVRYFSLDLVARCAFAKRFSNDCRQPGDSASIRSAALAPSKLSLSK